MTYIGIDIGKNFYVGAEVVKGKSRVQMTALPTWYPGVECEYWMM